MAERKQVDWEGVERDYSAGLLSLREIAAKYDTKESSIRYKANQNDWSRDLSKKIEQKTNEKLRKIELRTELRSEKAISEKEIIEASAQAIVNVKLEHRGDIRKSKRIVNSLFDELEITTDNRELFEQLGEILRNESDSGQDKLNDIYKKVISMPQRIDGVKKLTDALKTMIGLEREAYDIQSAPTPTENAVTELLKACQGNAVSITTSTTDFDEDDE
jgi:hypothetical protein